MTISVFLAGDNLIVLEGVNALVDLEDDFAVAEQHANFHGLFSEAETANPLAIATDIGMLDVRPETYELLAEAVMGREAPMAASRFPRTAT